MSKVCNICHKNEAEIQLKGLFNEKTIKVDMCEDCARKKGFESNPEMALIEFVNAFHHGSHNAQSTKTSLTACYNCGTTIPDLKQKGRMGCEKCYSSFGETIISLLEHIHGCHKHCGKKPGQSEKIFDHHIESELRKNLEKAVRQEDYELAAHLRDELKKTGI